jgi:hypothetical protein
MMEKRKRGRPPKSKANTSLDDLNVPIIKTSQPTTLVQNRPRRSLPANSVLHEMGHSSSKTQQTPPQSRRKSANPKKRGRKPKSLNTTLDSTHSSSTGGPKKRGRKPKSAASSSNLITSLPPPKVAKTLKPLDDDEESESLEENNSDDDDEFNVDELVIDHELDDDDDDDDEDETSNQSDSDFQEDLKISKQFRKTQLNVESSGKRKYNTRKTAPLKDNESKC